MNDETTQKQTWQTPEIVDLDVERTGSGFTIWAAHEDTWYRPS